MEWAKKELQGYEDSDVVPAYREHVTGVMGLYTGPMRSQVKMELEYHEEFDSLFRVHLRQPLLELQALADADGDSDPQRSWPAWAVQEYERRGILRLNMHGLFSAGNVLTRQSLRGIVDTVRTKAMEFALELQMLDPKAGSVGGPTVASSQAIAHTVYNITNNITGHGTNVAAGAGFHQKSVVKGDVTALRRSLEDVGLSKDDAEEFASALVEEGMLEGPRTRGFLERVRTGAVVASGSIASNVLAGSLVEIGKSFLGLG